MRGRAYAMEVKGSYSVRECLRRQGMRAQEEDEGASIVITESCVLCCADGGVGFRMVCSVDSG